MAPLPGVLDPILPQPCAPARDTERWPPGPDPSALCPLPSALCPLPWAGRASPGTGHPGSRRWPVSSGSLSEAGTQSQEHERFMAWGRLGGVLATARGPRVLSRRGIQARAPESSLGRQTFQDNKSRKGAGVCGCLRVCEQCEGRCWVPRLLWVGGVADLCLGPREEGRGRPACGGYRPTRTQS